MSASMAKCNPSTESILCDLDTRESSIQGEGYVYFGLVLQSITTVIMIILTAIHIRKVYLDLRTETRKSVEHRREKPKITILYQRINLLIPISMIFFTLSSLSGVFSPWSTSNTACNRAIVGQVVFVQLGKTCMCLAFLLRLQRIYEKSPFRYPLACIYFFYIALIVYAIIVVSFTMAFVKAFVQDFGNPGFPNLCQPVNASLFIKLAATIFIEDVACSVGFLWAYRIPLNRTYIAFTKKSPSIAKKVAYSGYKMCVLVATATISTLILTILVGLTQLGVFAIPDVIIDAVCLMCMTAYYKDDDCYKRFCGLCIICCHGDSPDMELGAVLSNEESYRSADTGSQVRQAAQKLTVEAGVDSGTEMKSVASDSAQAAVIAEDNIKPQDDDTEKP